MFTTLCGSSETKSTFADHNNLEMVATKKFVVNQQQQQQKSSSTVGLRLNKKLNDSLRLVTESDSTNNDGSVSGMIVTPMLIYNGYVNLAMNQQKFTNFLTDVKTIIQDIGYIQEESSMHNVEGSFESLQLILRISSSKFYDVLDQLGKFEGVTIHSLSSNSQDVTDQYVDATARSEVLDATRKSFQTLLEQANNIEDILKIQQELKQLTEEYESQRRRALQLKSQADYSTLRVTATLNEEPQKFVGRNTWGPFRPALVAINHMLVVWNFFLAAAMYAIVWMIPLGIFRLIQVAFRKREEYRKEQESLIFRVPFADHIEPTPWWGCWAQRRQKTTVSAKAGSGTND